MSLFHSRRMLCLERRISEAIVRVFERSSSSEQGSSAAAAMTSGRRCWAVTRITMNLYSFERRRRPVATPMTATTNSTNDDEYSNTAILQKLISVIMQDVQQRNLNAKHTAAAATAIKQQTVGNGDGESSLYVRLNRSCNQRKIVEVCCVLHSRHDVTVFRQKFQHPVIIRDGGLEKDYRSSRRNNNDGALMYGRIEKRELFSGQILREFRTLPTLVFVSCKSLVLVGANGTGLPRAVDENDDDDDDEAAAAAASWRLPLRRHLLYVANFVAYYAFHESDESFDMRRFGTRYRHMRALLFILALVNAELFRVNRCRNVNLSLNMQSLGKAYDDAGLHVFSENSIQHVRKVTCGSSNDNRHPAAIFSTSGHLVNRCLGRVSELGINGVTLMRPVFPSGAAQLH